MKLKIKDFSAIEYEQFLRIKQVPSYSIKGTTITFPGEYLDFVKTGKSNSLQDLNIGELSDFLFDYQKFIVNISLKRKRYACFADCGLGKTAMFLEIIQRLRPTLNGMKILIVSPLMVIEQTIDEEEKWYGKHTIENLHGKNIQDWLNGTIEVGIINYDVFKNGVDLTKKVKCIILDESSILKNSTGIIRTNIIKATKGIEYKFCYTATPAPNDREEYANHALFLEQVRSYQEFFAKYFVNKDNGWILKPHAKEAFYRHLATFSVFLRHPKNYGFADVTKTLIDPEIKVINVNLTQEQQALLNIFQQNLDNGQVINNTPKTFEQRNKFSQISKGFLLEGGKLIQKVDTNKTKIISDLIKKHPQSQVIIWTVYNEEGELLEAELSKNYEIKNISGSMNKQKRYEVIKQFKNGKIKILISKPRLIGFGLNFPKCNVQIFSGLNDSYEQFYQSIKRSHRFGATEKLTVYIPVTEPERVILENVLNKKEMFDADAIHQESLWMKWLKNEIELFSPQMRINVEEEENNMLEPILKKDYEIYNGDGVVKLRDFPDDHFDFSVFSPPFSSLFTYSNHDADMGNCDDNDNEFGLHFKFFLKELFRTMKKGRVVCMHLSQLSTFKGREGYVGVKDFRGLIIKLCEEAGFRFFGEWIIPKNPQMQAIKEKVRSLSFAQLEADRLGSRPGFNDMILILKKPGNADAKVTGKEVTRDEWIEWACGVWTGIRESDTLNVRGTKSKEDVKHVCPMNLEVIDRCVRMYSNKGERVLSPFMGIGSEGVGALCKERKFTGIELKAEYFKKAHDNLEQILKVRGNGEKEKIKLLRKRDIKTVSIKDFIKAGEQ